MPVLRFHLLTITHEQVNGSVIVTITTNAACHLYLRYSDIFPRIHRKGVARRGLVMGWDARYCFAAYQHIEQNEPGDEWTHTFTWPGWENCNTRYFYFWGTMGGQDMVSDTPIFWIHYLAVEIPPFVYFYPDPHPELTSVDGWVRQDVNAPNDTWAHLRDGAGTTFGDSSAFNPIAILAWDTAGGWKNLNRTILLFDTSSIGPGKTILAAQIRVKSHAYSFTAPLWGPTLAVVASLPAANTILEIPDYTKLGIVPLSNALAWALFPPEATNTFTFNSDGLLAIDPEGITKLGLREGTYDRPNISPPWKKYGYAYIDIYSAEHAEEPFRPQLGVAYI